MNRQPGSVIRRLPVGAEVQRTGGVHFRVWAPRSSTVKLILTDGGEDPEMREYELAPERDGYFSSLIAEAREGQHYRYRLERGTFPDPASRFQPEGPHGPSRIVDSARFTWTDQQWAGVPPERQVIYEMHIGTFTAKGTWAAAAELLPDLADLGVTILEVMPVADFPGRYGWGYDGVNLFAPTRLYGEPDDFRRFVDRAHALGLGVILDVVYNHLGPDGNYLPEFAEHYFGSKHTEWGNALNFDEADCAPVREFFVSNAGYWIDEFHLDGLRLDATQQIFDRSAEHLVAAVTRRAREAGGKRKVFIVAENEPQEARLIRSPERGGYGLDAMWNDDFHHSAVVALTGRSEAYYTDYTGSAQEFISAVKHGFLYQGQWYKWQQSRRGSPCFDLQPHHFVTFIQNHDQIANSLWGRRIHDVTSACQFRAMTGFLLLGPNTPMLFQGQEFAATTPFLYFADHNPDLAKLVADGRTKFLSQFPSIASPGAADLLADPELESTFTRCKLDFTDREKHRPVYEMHRDLLRLRREDPLLGKCPLGTYDGAVLGSCAFVLRYFGQAQNDRLLLVNLGPALEFDPSPEPLLAPVEGHEWALAWSSDDVRYGGDGVPPIETEDNRLSLPARTTLLLTPKPSTDADKPDPSH